MTIPLNSRGQNSSFPIFFSFNHVYFDKICQKHYIFLKNLSILDFFAVSHLLLSNISWKGLNKSFIVCLICRRCSSFSYFSAKSPYFYLIATFCWNGLLLLFSRLIPGFPNSRFFLEPVNRELEGTTVHLASKSETFWNLEPCKLGTLNNKDRSCWNETKKCSILLFLT